jgi:aminoglycoside phosphotransferase (APT) family kinase protein
VTPPGREALAVLCARLAPGGRIVRVWPLKGGVSSIVHAVRLEAADGSRRDVVVRRFGDYWQRTDPHVAVREFRLLQHLVQHTGLPVAEPLMLDGDGSLFGAPTNVMTRLPGRAEMTPRDVDAFMRRMAETLVAIHRVDTRELDFLRPQAPRLDGILDAGPPSNDPLVQSIWRELRREAPRVKAGLPDKLVHADYWPGNLLWRRERLVGVVDWENPRRGDPTEDLSTVRREMWLLFGSDAADRLTDYYIAAGGEVREQRFWDLWQVSDAIIEMADWLPGYHALGRTDLTLEFALGCMRAFAESALSRG